MTSPLIGVGEVRHVSLLRRIGRAKSDSNEGITSRCANDELPTSRRLRWERSGWLNAYNGEPDAAIAHFEPANRLDASGPNPNRLTGIDCAHFDAGRYVQAASGP
jgi:hypothetical protein